MDISNISATPYSNIKMLQHKTKIYKLKQKDYQFAPNNIQIDLTGYCNNSCSFCAYRNSNWEKKGMKFYDERWTQKIDGKTKERLIPEISVIPKEIALDLPRQMAELEIKAVEITGGGEPTLCPYFQEFIEECKKYDIEIGLVTHGQTLRPTQIQALKESKLKWVRFSMDSCTTATHDEVHCVKDKFNKAIDTIKEFLKDKAHDTVISVSYIITKDNWKEIYESTEFYKKLGVDAIRFSYEYDADGSKKIDEDTLIMLKVLLNQSHKLATDKFKVLSENYRLSDYYRPNDDFHFCSYQFFTVAIGYTGEVWPCCIMKYHPGFEMGNIKKQSLKEIFLGEGRNKFVEEFDVKKCKNCWLRNKNILMESHMKTIHENFT